MKGIALCILLLSGVFVNGQTLKELLYSGKLKSDTGSLVRKSDDLSTKIDTSTRKKPVEPEKQTSIQTIAVIDSSTGEIVTKSDTLVLDASGELVAAPGTENSGPKDNNQRWKEFIDEMTGTLRTEVLPSNKVKKGNYSILIEYEIGVEGEVSVVSVSSDPANSFLEQQVRERITLLAPKMTPLLNAYGKPRKALKKHTLVIAK